MTFVSLVSMQNASVYAGITVFFNDFLKTAENTKLTDFKIDLKK